METQFSGLIEREEKRDAKVAALEASSLRLEGAWRMVKLGAAVLVGGIGAVGGLLKLLGVV